MRNNAMRSYVYRKRWLRILAGCFDGVGFRLMKRRSRPLPLQGSLAVICLDHIGDIVFVAPLLQAIKQLRPAYRLEVITHETGRQLLGRLDSVDAFHVLDDLWFKKQGFANPAGFGGVRRLSALLKKIAPALIVDTRGDIRFILSMVWGAPSAYRLGSGITGGGFLLDTDIPADDTLHAAEKNMRFLSALGHPPNAKLSAKDFAPLKQTSVSPSEADAWGLAGVHKKVILHLGAGSTSKQWPLTHWRKLVNAFLSSGCDVRLIAVGDVSAGALYRQVVKERDTDRKPRVLNLCGQIPLNRLEALLAEADLLISADSGPVHLAAISEIPTLVLFSGTAEWRIWRPINAKAVRMEHAVSCSPCHSRVCLQKTHACMEGISPEEVFKKACEILGFKSVYPFG